MSDQSTKTQPPCHDCNEPYERPVTSNRRYCQICLRKRWLEGAKKNSGAARKLREGWVAINGEKKLDPHGYVFILVDGKWLAEHRYVMEQHLQRPLVKGESVHHKNGVRNDNSIENLELWVVAIRYGQRASDVVCPICNVDYLTAIQKTKGDTLVHRKLSETNHSVAGLHRPADPEAGN